MSKTLDLSNRACNLLSTDFTLKVQLLRKVIPVQLYTLFSQFPSLLLARVDCHTWMLLRVQMSRSFGTRLGLSLKLCSTLTHTSLVGGHAHSENVSPFALLLRQPSRDLSTFSKSGPTITVCTPHTHTHTTAAAGDILGEAEEERERERVIEEEEGKEGGKSAAEQNSLSPRPSVSFCSSCPGGRRTYERTLYCTVHSARHTRTLHTGHARKRVDSAVVRAWCYLCLVTTTTTTTVVGPKTGGSARHKKAKSNA